MSKEICTYTLLLHVAMIESGFNTKIWDSLQTQQSGQIHSNDILKIQKRKSNLNTSYFFYIYLSMLFKELIYVFQQWRQSLSTAPISLMEHGVFLMGGQCFWIGGRGSQISNMNTVSQCLLMGQKIILSVLFHCILYANENSTYSLYFIISLIKKKYSKRRNGSLCLDKTQCRRSMHVVGFQG